MKVHELNEGNEVIVYYKGRVDDMSVPDFETHTAHIKLDNGKSITITDEDYFDIVKSEDCENNTDTPAHYKGKDGIDVIEFLRQQMTPQEFKGFMTGNIIKYATRLGRKDDEMKEVEKIEVYAKRLKEVLAHE